MVGNAAQFFVGQSLRVQSSTDFESATVSAVDSGTNTVTLITPLNQTWPVGAAVLDSRLAANLRGYTPRGVSTLNSGNEVLISPSELASNTNTLIFNATSIFSGVTIGDTIAFDADGSTTTTYNRATAVVTSIRTTLADGSALLDGNGVAVVEFGLSTVEFFEDGITSLPLDSTTAYVIAQSDSVLIEGNYL